MESYRGRRAQQLAELVLAKARQDVSQARAIGSANQRRGPLGTIRRKYLIHQAKELASRYSLDEQLNGYVYAADCEAITGLDLSELEALVSWLEDLGARVATACDALQGPPAR